MEPAQAYVMLSRVQALSQLFIIEKIPKEKIYPSLLALKELERLQSISLNEKEVQPAMITSLNIRSLPKHIVDLSNDYKMNNSKVICIQETWCSQNYDNSHLM